MAAASGRLLLCVMALQALGSPLGAQHGGGPGDPRLADYVGAYRLGSEGTAAISHFVHGENHIYLFTDFEEGWRGVLTPAAGDTFRIVPHEGPPAESSLKIVLEHGDAGPVSLTLLSEDRPPRLARQLDLTIDSVRFEGEEALLAGEIILPVGDASVPGMVFVHGSGPATRSDYREWSYFFAAEGVAVLIYDKRGAGGSGGDFRRADFHDLAADAVAAVRRLQRHPRVERSRVGLSGGSQGAWVAPIAAGHLPDLAFLVLTGGGPITPAEQEIYRRARIVQDSGYARADVEDARALVARYFEYLGTAGRDDRLSRAVSADWQRYAGEPWFPLLSLPRTDPTVGEWPEGRRRFAAELHFDPGPFMCALRVPTLAVLGAEDQGFPVRRTAAAYAETVPEHLLTTRIILNADHGFWVTDDRGVGRHQSPQVFSHMLEWIRSVVRSSRETKLSLAHRGKHMRHSSAAPGEPVRGRAPLRRDRCRVSRPGRSWPS